MSTLRTALVVVLNLSLPYVPAINKTKENTIQAADAIWHRLQMP